MAQQKRTRLPMREMQEMRVQFLGGQDLLEKEMALSNNKFLCNCNFMCLVIQSWLTLCDPMDYGLPVSFVHGIFQARILEGVVFSKL